MIDERLNKFYFDDYHGEESFYFLYEKNTIEIKFASGEDYMAPARTHYKEQAEATAKSVSERVKQNVNFVSSDSLFYVIDIDQESTIDGYELWYVMAEDKIGWMFVPTDDAIEPSSFKVADENWIRKKRNSDE